MAKKRIKRRKPDGMEVLASASSKAEKPRISVKKEKPRVKREKQKPAICTCGVCGEEAELAYSDADDEWAAPGHPDHYVREIGVCCSEWAIGRDMLSLRVIKEVKARAKNAGDGKLEKLAAIINPRDVEPGGRADAELTKWARKLGIESKWLEDYAA